MVTFVKRAALLVNRVCDMSICSYRHLPFLVLGKHLGSDRLPLLLSEVLVAFCCCFFVPLGIRALV